MGESAEVLSVRSYNEIRGRPAVTLDWFVCLTISMVTMSNLAGMENTVFDKS